MVGPAAGGVCVRLHGGRAAAHAARDGSRFGVVPGAVVTLASGGNEVANTTTDASGNALAIEA
jgi:hypothetical protein